MTEATPPCRFDNGACRATVLALLMATILLAGCASLRSAPDPATAQEGIAAYYGARFAGRPTANGEHFDPDELTAAHRSLPFDTRVEVTNLDNGRQVTVRINDRGPFTSGRIIDLSRGAAERLGMIRSGVAPVRLQVMN